MEYTCEDCMETFESLEALAYHCKQEGHYDEEAQHYLDREAKK